MNTAANKAYPSSCPMRAACGYAGRSTQAKKRKMNNRISKIENNVQDRNSKAWKMLCEYVDRIAEEGKDEFAPYEELGADLYSEIYTLPESISKLKKVKKIWLYGSKLKRIPPEIGQMESLEYFDPYTSYNLHWFPFELT